MFFMFAAGAPLDENATEIGVESGVQKGVFIIDSTTPLLSPPTNTLTTSTTLDATEQAQVEPFELVTYYISKPFVPLADFETSV